MVSKVVFCEVNPWFCCQGKFCGFIVMVLFSAFQCQLFQENMGFELYLFLWVIKPWFYHDGFILVVLLWFQYQPFQENMDIYTGLESFVTNGSQGRKLNITAENECRKLHCSLRDLSSLLQVPWYINLLLHSV